MWKPSLHASQRSPVPSSLPLSAEEAVEESSIRQSAKQASPSSPRSPSSDGSPSLAAPLQPWSLLLSSPPSLLVPSSLSLSVDRCSASVAAAGADDGLSSSFAADIPDSPPSHCKALHSTGDGLRLSDATIRQLYRRQPRQRADIDPYTLYCGLTDGDRSAGREASQLQDGLLCSHVAPSQSTSSSMSTPLQPTAGQQPTRAVPLLVTPIPRVTSTPADSSPRVAASFASPPLTECASLSLLDMSFVDLPSQLHRLRDTPPDGKKLAAATLSLSYHSTAHTSTIASQHSTLDLPVAGLRAIPFPRLSDASAQEAADHTDSAPVEASAALPAQSRRRVGAYRVEQNGVLLPDMRSALIPAPETSVGLELAAATVPTSEQPCSSTVPLSAALPAASPDLRGLHCRMYAIQAALTGCGCRPYHVRVLRLASVALEALCERESLFATRDILVQQIGCTRDVLRWVERFDLSGHAHSCSHIAKRRRAVDQQRAAAESRRAVEWRKAAARRDDGPTQIDEFVRHNSSFSYPSSECTA